MGCVFHWTQAVWRKVSFFLLRFDQFPISENQPKTKLIVMSTLFNEGKRLIMPICQMKLES